MLMASQRDYPMQRKGSRGGYVLDVDVERLP